LDLALRTKVETMAVCKWFCWISLWKRSTAS